MKLIIKIPKEFEKHFEKDKFEDSLKRLKGDAGTFCLAGRYEIELCEMLIEAFKEAEVVDEPWQSKNPYLVKQYNDKKEDFIDASKFFDSLDASMIGDFKLN